MEKSFYFEVGKFDEGRITEHLEKLQMEFQIEKMGEQILFIFPDVPVWDYGEIRQVFGRDCLSYRSLLK